MGAEMKVRAVKLDILDDLHEVISMVAFMDYSTRMILDVVSQKGEAPTRYVIDGMAAINLSVGNRLKSIVNDIDDYAVFPESI